MAAQIINYVGFSYTIETAVFVRVRYRHNQHARLVVCVRVTVSVA